MGASHARKFVEEGAKVVITDLNEGKGQATAKELGENALFVKQNVTSEADWKNVIQETEKKFGPVNVLVNNAGITMSKSILEATEEDYRRILDINQASVFLGMKSVIPSMKKAENGSIVNISSMKWVDRRAIGYTDSKFAVRGMTKAAALECSPLGIRVNSVHPDIIATPMVLQEDTKDVVEEFSKNIPLRRVADRKNFLILCFIWLRMSRATLPAQNWWLMEG